MAMQSFIVRGFALSAAVVSFSGADARLPSPPVSVAGEAYALRSFGDRVTVASRKDATAAVHFELRSLRGADGEVTLEPAQVDAHRDGLVRFRGPIEEFYSLGARTTEQGFVLPAPIAAGRGEVTLGIEVTGLRPVVERGDLLALVDDAGRARLRYGEVHVFDATRRELPSQLRVVGRRIDLVFDDTDARYPVLVDPAVWTVTDEVLPLQSTASGRFGASIAISGDVLVVGEPGFTGGAGVGQGQAHVFLRNGLDWQFDVTLTPSSQVAGTNFGEAVAVDFESNRTRIVIGAPGTAGGTSRGLAFVFDRTGTGSFGQVPLTTMLPAIANGDQFGASVGIDGGLVVVGAPALGSNVGGVEIFKDNGLGAYPSTETLPLTAGATSDKFGSSVAIAGTRIAVGVTGASDIVALFGRVDLFSTADSTTWTLDGSIPQAGALPTTPSNALFGASLAMDASTLLIGAPGFLDGAFTDAGRVFVFDATTRMPITFAAATSPSNFERFGDAVAFDGNTYVVGVPGSSTAAGIPQRVEVFTRSGTSLGTSQIVGFNGVTSADSFGSAVAISSGASPQLIVGAPSRTLSTRSGAGAAEVVRLAGAVGDTCGVDTDCGLGFCVDGVCCNAACGGSVTTDCQACSASMGSTVDGMCTTLTTGTCAGGGDGGMTPTGTPFADPRALSCAAQPSDGPGRGGLALLGVVCGLIGRQFRRRPR